MRYKAELNNKIIFHLFKRNLYREHKSHGSGCYAPLNSALCPWYKLFFMVFISVLLSSCAVKEYYPLKNDAYFQEDARRSHKAVLMPFNVNINTHYSATNTLEKREEKSRYARKFIANSIKLALSQSHYDVVAHISLDELIKDNFDRETRLIIDELFFELNDANFSIQHNLEEEEGKGFDYSIGIRAREIAGLFDKDPDVLVFLHVGAFVRDLRALESNGTNPAEDIITLVKVAPTPGDVIYVILTLVDADTGDIFWRDSAYASGRSVLRPSDINYAVRKLSKNLSISMVRQSMSYVK